MNAKKVRIARIVGIACIVIGLVYWVASFFIPGEYERVRPREDRVFSTKVVDPTEEVSTSSVPAPESSPMSSSVPRLEGSPTNGPAPRPEGGSQARDPLSGGDGVGVEVPPGLRAQQPE